MKNKKNPRKKKKSEQGSQSNLTIILAAVFGILAVVLITWIIYAFQQQSLRQQSPQEQENEQEEGRVEPEEIESTVEQEVKGPTADWVTYKDAINEFELQYPENYETKELRGEGGGLVTGTMIVKKDVEVQALEPYVNIYEASQNISNNPNASTLSDYENNYFANEVRKVAIELESQKDLIINNISAIKQVYSAGDAKERLNEADFTPDNWNSLFIFDLHDLHRTSFGYTSGSIRYIFSDNKGSFIILETEEQFEFLLDGIAETFKFAN